MGVNYYNLMCTKRVGWLCLLTAFISLGASPATAQLTADNSVNNFESADKENSSKFSTNSNSLESNAIAQVTSVSQLSDVKTTDWAFQALQSVVERYGCIVGYPDSTYKGNRALSRYEFAAGLNACLDRINELIATSTGDLVKKEDLTTL